MICSPIFTLYRQQLFQLSAPFSDGQAAFSGLPQGFRHRAADPAHGIDDLIGGNGTFNTGQCHLGAGGSIDGAGGISFDTGNLYQAANRIAGQSKHVF